ERTRDIRQWISWSRRPAGCFFFQAEDGIRDFHVTGVQTCALPIYRGEEESPRPPRFAGYGHADRERRRQDQDRQRNRRGSFPRWIGRASCRERVESWVAAVPLREKRNVSVMENGRTGVQNEESVPP